MFAAPGSDSADPDDELVSYVTGEKDVPVPTYTLGGWGKCWGVAAVSGVPVVAVRLMQSHWNPFPCRHWQQHDFGGPACFRLQTTVPGESRRGG
jgi:hypothetical protein